MFTENWARYYDDWQGWLGEFQNKPCVGLEIGVYEGRSTVWLFENILTNPAAKLYQIDPFDSFDGIAGDYEKRYAANVKKYAERIELLRGYSQEIMRTWDGGAVDFIIVDGSHVAADVMSDAVNGWQILKPGGVMIFDDYLWMGQGHSSCTEQDKPRIAIDAFIQAFNPRVIKMDYQVAVKKA